MIPLKNNLYISILFIIFTFLSSKDISTFSNYEQIIQTNIELNFDIDFEEKIIHGLAKIYFKSLKYGEVIILDTRFLKINSIIDSDTGEQLDYILDTHYELASNGIPLKIYKEYEKDEVVTILISFETTEKGTSVMWLTPEQTSGKKYPYMFTQGETILNRELFPSQDTPSVKTSVNVGITVIKPLVAVESGIYQKKIDNGNTITYFYEQRIPIPSYLIAMAAGAIEERIISDRTKVYAEKELIDKAVYEFEDIDNYIQVAESYLFPYEWGEYNLLIMPPSFPYGGMENPTLTFVMPSIISGDKSLIGLATHEISHSWCGNLVTMKDWSNFWLNEGFDVFMETKIIELMKGKEMAKLHALTYKNMLNDVIVSLGESKSFTSLQPYLLGRHPDDAFSVIPYIKGFLFLYFLEDLVNSKSDIDLFRKILRNYYTNFKYQSINYKDFKDFFENIIKEELPSEAENILNQIDWIKWIEAPGMPPKDLNFSNTYDNIVKEMINLFYENQLPSDFDATFKKWDIEIQTDFIAYILEREKELDDGQYNYLINTLNLTRDYNVQIKVLSYEIVLSKRNALEDKIKEELIEFLGTVGRINYLRELYPLFYKKDANAALETFEKYKSFYHPMVAKYIEIALNNIS